MSAIRWNPNRPTKPGRYLVAMVNHANKMRFIQPETLAENGHWCLETRDGVQMPNYGPHIERVGWWAFPDFPGIYHNGERDLPHPIILYTPEKLPKFDPENDL